MTEEVAARPKTSGKKSTPSELEEWARKKSPKPPSAAPPPAPEPEEPEQVFAMKKGLPEVPGKSQARFVAGDRGVTGTSARVPIPITHVEWTSQPMHARTVSSHSI